ncbi:hypothetical protein CEW89_11525 [Celeribacter ethanolicus]|uniref:Polysaccharide pyruvyl transferase domain-containing protein n=1 Tax=Celeribacter ethanolicus TaxID=1758178 RepID=A0A291GDP9_9RHOB|nr:polysaccharide pyruvyl transferase family protein [Celeribacter ethanolicus]ATG48146.1 hypothetical protein CEW89_11525 [Celeribacter ethanolicus]
MKVMITNAYGRSNRGDSVLLDECIAEITSAVPDAEIGCSVFEGIAASRAVHPDVTWSERIGNTSASGKLAKLVTLMRLLIAALATVPGLSFVARLLPSSQYQSWKMIRAADIVVSAPGGYIHDTNFAYYVALLHIFLPRKAARNILAPQSIGPIDTPFARLIARWIFMKTDAICARESYSWHFLHETLALPERLLRRSGDSAFWNFYVSNAGPAIVQAWHEIGVEPSAKPILGLTVVNWTFPKSVDMEMKRRDYVTSMAKIIDHMTKAHDMQPVIFNQVSDDLPMAERIAAACDTQVAIDRTSREPEELRALIGRSSLFLGTRFHSCIFAMMADRPTQAIAYLPKTSYILRDLKLDERQFPIDDLDPTAVIAALERDFSDLATARAEISGAVETYRQTHAKLSDVLQETT